MMEHGNHATGEMSAHTANSAVATTTVEQPKAPNPSADPGVIPPINSPNFNEVGDLGPDDDFDIDTLEPLLALKLLARGIQGLVDLTGDIPPTPLVVVAPVPKVGILSRLSSDFARTGLRPITPPSNVPPDDINSPTFRNVQIGSPEAHAHEEVPLTAERRVQMNAISRRFFSKKPPPISIDDYLLRLHRYCPMSSAVYLAAGLYIRKIALEEKAVPVTSRSVHRLLLASLRVAMKVLEDLSYPHQRFAGVGGVTEKELSKLEVNMCYLTNFELRVTSKSLYESTRTLQQLAMTSNDAAADFKLDIPVRARRGTVA